MALEDRDFIARQVELIAKGLAKVIDMEVLEKMFSKENVENIKEADKQAEESKE